MWKENVAEKIIFYAFFFSRPTYNIYTGNDYYYRGLTYQNVPKRIIYSRGERREDMWAGILSNICLLDFFFFNYYLLFLSRRLVVPLFFLLARLKNASCVKTLKNIALFFTTISRCTKRKSNSLLKTVVGRHCGPLWSSYSQPEAFCVLRFKQWLFFFFEISIGRK